MSGSPRIWLLAAALASGTQAAGAQQPVQAPAAPAPAQAQAQPQPEHTPVRARDRRHAAKIFLAASKLFEQEQFEAAMNEYERAATLDPENGDYPVAARVARSHLVTALIQQAVRERIQGNPAASRIALQRAFQLDPQNAQVLQHLNELGADVSAGLARPLYDDAASELGDAPELVPSRDKLSFHLRLEQRQLIQRVFKAYGLDATVDQSVQTSQVRLDLDDVPFSQASSILGMLTGSFWVPIDAHRALVARDTPQNREKFERQEVETVYLPGLTPEQATDISNVAKNVFLIQRSSLNQNSETLTLRAPSHTLSAFNQTLRGLLDGRSQVLLDVRIIQLARTRTRDTGLQLPTQITTFNVYTEEQSILNANQTLVQEIISSGLASADDPLAILAVLLASGEVTSSIFSNGFLLLGNGLTLTGVSPSPLSGSLSVNSSQSRALEQVQLRLGDGDAGTLRSGSRYPITTSSYSSLSSSSTSISGLTSAGNSTNLASLLSSLTSSTSTVPQIQYQDLGLTLKATPKVMRNGDIALTLDLSLTALAGSSLNGVPVLNNRSFSNVVTLPEGAAVVVAGELDKQESRALSGVAGLTEIPGFNNATTKDTDSDYSTLLVILSPHVLRGPQFSGHSSMLRITRSRGTSTP